jgi:hypothetical protein
LVPILLLLIEDLANNLVDLKILAKYLKHGLRKVTSLSRLWPKVALPFAYLEDIEQ